MIGDPVIIVSDKEEHERFHIVVQDGGNQDFNVTMCGIEVVVEDPDYLLHSDRDFLTEDMLCWECCEQFGRSGRHEAQRRS